MDDEEMFEDNFEQWFQNQQFKISWLLFTTIFRKDQL